MNYDRVLVLSAGKVVEEGPPQDLLSRKNSEFRTLAGDKVDQLIAYGKKYHQSKDQQEKRK